MFQVDFIHGAQACLSSAPLGEEAPLTYPTLQGPIPQGEHLPQQNSQCVPSREVLMGCHLEVM